jgi:hypothetical protein
MKSFETLTPAPLKNRIARQHNLLDSLQDDGGLNREKD